MNAPTLGSLLLGGILGAGLAWGGAWLWAQGKLVVLDAQHQADLDRLAMVQRLREDAIRRGLNVDGAELNLFQELAAKHRAKVNAGVLPMRKRE